MKKYVFTESQLKKIIDNQVSESEEKKEFRPGVNLGKYNLKSFLKDKDDDSDEEKDSKGSSMPFNFNVESLLGNNSFIKGLMNDIKDEFKDFDLPENPTDIGSVFKSLQNPATQAKMQNIMGKMAKHFEGGNMGDLSNLQAQAQQMMQSMGINPEQLAQQAEAMGLNQGQVNKLKTANRNESARQRLQRKFQEKQDKEQGKQ